MRVEDAAARVRAADVVLSDLDGCLASGNRPYAGAADFAQFLGDRLYIVSNNSTEDAEALSAILAEGGMEVAPERILLAGELAVRLLAEEQPGARVLLLGSETLRSCAESLGLVLTEMDPAVVLLARDTAFTYEKLQTVARVLDKGASLIAANPDLTHPGPDGHPVPETGSLLAAIQAVAPKVQPRVIGKPNAAIYQEALRRADVTDAKRAMMMGDNPLTDIAGAKALGMPSLLITPAPQVGQAERGLTVTALAKELLT